jgi:hypothetical protein
MKFFENKDTWASREGEQWGLMPPSPWPSKKVYFHTFLGVYFENNMLMASPPLKIILPSPGKKSANAQAQAPTKFEFSQIFRH